MLDFATSTVSRPVKHLGVLLAWMVHRHLAPVRTSPAAAEGGSPARACLGTAIGLRPRCRRLLLMVTVVRVLVMV